MAYLYRSKTKKIDMMVQYHNNDGVILVLVLLFLSVFSFLSLTILHTSLLETKMVANYQDSWLSFIKAQSNLIKKEQAILPGKPLPSGVGKIAGFPAGEVFYKIVANGDCHNTTTTLQSVCFVGKYGKRRVSWITI